jgi:hypothetical protein
MVPFFHTPVVEKNRHVGKGKVCRGELVWLTRKFEDFKNEDVKTVTEGSIQMVI